MSAPARPSIASSFRVVHVFPNCARLSCGPCNAIMAFMESQLQQGLDVRAISPSDIYIPAEKTQPIEHLPIEEFDPETADVCAVALAAAGPRTVFHFHGLSPWTDKIARLLEEKSIPYVFTSHGQLHFHGPVHWLKKFVYLNALNFFIRKASGLHFLTRREKDRSKFILPFWRKPVLIQPNLIRLPQAQTVTAASRDELGIPANAFVFAYLGRLDVRHKGLDILLQAFARLAGKTNAWLLVIGPDFAGRRQFLEQLATTLGCEKQICFVGPQVGSAKWALLKLADAFVSPSRWEAFGIAPAEAIGLGLPTIISDRFNMAPTWEAGHIAFVSPLSAGALASSMQQIMTDADLRHSLSKAGRQWVAETCSHEHAGKRFAEFYESVLPG